MSESSVLFVRGKYQLARYEEASAATGRRLTEHEVLEAYGADVIPEIDDRLSAVLLAGAGVIESSLRKQREELGVTQRELASAANVGPEIVERAERTPICSGSGTLSAWRSYSASIQPN